MLKMKSLAAQTPAVNLKLPSEPPNSKQQVKSTFINVYIKSKVARFA